MIWLDRQFIVPNFKNTKKFEIKGILNTDINISRQGFFDDSGRFVTNS